MNAPEKKSRHVTVVADRAADAAVPLTLLGAALPHASGAPLKVDIERIHPDPNQPRSMANPGFSEASIAELAASFGPEGPKSPISVRDHPTLPGHYMINHGERRWRAAVLKGLTKLGVFIDNNHTEDDQVIENVQREDMLPREIAEYIRRKLKQGLKKKEVAELIGKSPSFITQHAALLDLPGPIAKVFNTGRANDVTVVSELVTAYKKNPKEVEAWLEDDNHEVTRGEVKLLREFLDEKRKNNENDLDLGTVDLDTGSSECDEDDITVAQAEHGSPSVTKASKTDSEKLTKAVVQVRHNGRPARLILTRRPKSKGYIWISYDGDSTEVEASMADIKLVALLEG